MTHVALIVAMILQLTGLWPLLPGPNQTSISQAASVRASPKPVEQAFEFNIPVPTDAAKPIFKTSASVYSFDQATSMPLFRQNIDQRRPVASITKLITAMVILDRHKPTDIVTIGQLPVYPIEAETIGLRQGETYTVGSLVTAALVPSANDAADALAIYDAGSVAAFATRMNAKMAQWHIPDTHWSNASGLVDDNNYASARALGQIATLAIKQTFITSVIKLPNVSITSISGRTFNLNNTNKLLATGSFYGIKTGYTEASGECFIGITKANGHKVVTVLLGADDRFGDTQTLVNWIGIGWKWL